MVIYIYIYMYILKYRYQVSICFPYFPISIFDGPMIYGKDMSRCIEHDSVEWFVDDVLDCLLIPAAYYEYFLQFAIDIFTWGKLLSKVPSRTYLPIYLSTYLPTYLSTYLPIYLPIYLSTYLSIYLPT